ASGPAQMETAIATVTGRIATVRVCMTFSILRPVLSDAVASVKLLFWAIAFHGRPSRQASQPVDQSNFPAHRTIRMRTLTGETNKPEGQVMNNRSLKGKSVLIGGGAKNLGGLISRTFATDGARICVHYNSASTKKDAEKTVADIKAAGGEAFAVQGDFTKA